MNKNKHFNKIIKNFLNKSAKEKITIVILIGVLLLVIIIPTGDKQDSTKEQAEIISSEGTEDYSLNYEEYIEEKLEETLKLVEGVGKVEAVVTIKASEENVLAKDSEYSSTSLKETDSAGGVRAQENNNSKYTYIYHDGDHGNEPYVVQTNMPKIEGVVIVAKGGGDGNIASAITSAVEALLNIPAHKIKVLKMS